MGAKRCLTLLRGFKNTNCCSSFCLPQLSEIGCQVVVSLRYDEKQSTLLSCYPSTAGISKYMPSGQESALQLFVSRRRKLDDFDAMKTSLFDTLIYFTLN